ncbi:hypothetical protein TNCV_4156281 [Trichonephila clavipes]|nr:hypothetical protein TNCV_4156281 [Trichonephila clavipes]
MNAEHLICPELNKESRKRAQIDGVTCHTAGLRVSSESSQTVQAAPLRAIEMGHLGKWSRLEVRARDSISMRKECVCI